MEEISVFTYYFSILILLKYEIYFDLNIMYCVIAKDWKNYSSLLLNCANFVCPRCKFWNWSFTWSFGLTTKIF